ncbi:centrosomal protein of 128 kDa isoform X2 [Periophthalmus magnuspinnatus]|uniref:centrosomal protein of 128 kDa isoform X2 n=1 Tax=Periophthalmus magnuspinnatus TaxID=409849 RepID=UPI002436D072|nr:centrosomal protein of 128 kDa isoform X2 [Periophthalmus magnuspinnatus]
MSSSMNTSSESDTYERTRGQRVRGRRQSRDRGRARDAPTSEISSKISTLANTLQSTSKNLNKVDRMLGQYREHTDDQAEAMALLRENLEDSISQLQAQRLSGRSGTKSASASASPLHTSDLDLYSESDSRRLRPTSPLRDYRSSPERRRRSHSSVRFKDAQLTGEEIHTLHQSLRDLRSDQQRLADDLGREILRRNRADIDTRRAMENLSEHMTASQRQDAVSSLVERRLQELELERELERELTSEKRVPERGRRTERRAAMCHVEELPEHHKLQPKEGNESITERLLQVERERTKMEVELDRARRLLEQSEDSRESLVQQVEDMRGELQRSRKAHSEAQRGRLESSQPIAPPHGPHTEREERGSGAGGTERSDLEKEVSELKEQLRRASVMGEVEELKRALAREEKEKSQLSLQVQELTSDLARREQQQLRMLEQLKELQGCENAEKRQLEEMLEDSKRSRDELKSKAQEAIRQWRAKCKRLQREREEAAGERESSHAQMKALSQQTEAARRELAEILGRLAHREEELRRKDVELSDSRQRQLSLEQEVREIREAYTSLEQEARNQVAVHKRLKEENQRLEERMESQVRRQQKDEEQHTELQNTVKQVTSSHAQLVQRLSEEESLRKELQKSHSELRDKLMSVQEERAALGKQLQLQREVHQKELDNMKAALEEGKSKKERDLQDMLRLFTQERDELQRHLKEVKADAASDRELCEALRIKLDRMKDECDKLAAQLSSKEDAHSLLQRKHQLLREELDHKVRSNERRRTSESELILLKEKVSKMEAEQEAVLTAMGEELDIACRQLAKNGEDKLQAILQKPGLVRDPHRWLAETKSKVRWLCEEVRERNKREQSLRRQHQHTKDQLKALRHSQDSEQADLLQRLDQQEKLLHSLSNEKHELLERSRNKDDEMRCLQDRVLELEMSTRAALDRLEAIPEKQSLMDNFKDLEESQRQREEVEQRYSKYKEIVWDLQNQLDESKRKIQEYREEKLDATSRSLRLAALSSSIKGPGAFLSSSLRSDSLSPPKRLNTLDLGSSTMNGIFSD